MSKPIKKTKVCVLGIWHLGSVYSGCLADLGYSVVGWDPDNRKVAELNEGKPPLFEPQLEELITRKITSGSLAYTTDIDDALRKARYVIIAFDTPVDDMDNVDLSPIFDTVLKIAKSLAENTILIVVSQVPIGTCEKIKSMISQQNPELSFDIAHCPENLRLGRAIEDFRHPDRIVIGTASPTASSRLEEFWSVVDAPRVGMDLRSAEMSKHALNAFLAMSISFGNEIGNLCDELGADALKVVDALRYDSRIGSKLPLRPGLGFAGATLARDIKILHNMGQKLNYETHLVDATLKVNQEQNRMVVKKLERFFGTVNNLIVGILGLTYKPGTSTLRRSVSLEIIEELISKGAVVKAYDPQASLKEVRGHPEFQFCSDAYEVARQSDALAIVTEWPQFKELDFERIRDEMKKPVLVDAKNILDKDTLVTKGFIYMGIGRGHSDG